MRGRAGAGFICLVFGRVKSRAAGDCRTLYFGLDMSELEQAGPTDTPHVLQSPRGGARDTQGARAQAVEVEIARINLHAAFKTNIWYNHSGVGGRVGINTGFSKTGTKSQSCTFAVPCFFPYSQTNSELRYLWGVLLPDRAAVYQGVRKSVILRTI